MSPAVAKVLRLVTTDPGRPRLTWYGEGGERVEISGAVLENWVNKTVNLLVEEFDAEPGARVVLDLPPHWRTVVWALAVWRAGACVVLAEDPTAADAPDVIVTDSPSRFHDASAPVVAVSLPALARRFDGELPPGAIDAASAVMTYGDMLGWVSPVDPQGIALIGLGNRLTHAELDGELDAATSEPGERTLIVSSEDRAIGAKELVRASLKALASGGSVVALDAPLAKEYAEQPHRLERLVADERVTAVIMV